MYYEIRDAINEVVKGILIDKKPIPAPPTDAQKAKKYLESIGFDLETAHERWLTDLAEEQRNLLRNSEALHESEKKLLASKGVTTQDELAEQFSKARDDEDNQEIIESEGLVEICLEILGGEYELHESWQY